MLRKEFAPILLVILMVTSFSAFAQVPVTVIPPAEQEAWLQSDDPQLAANKRIAFDLWRRAIVAADMDAARELMAEDYIQHNPNIPTGRAPFIGFFGQRPQTEALDHIPDLVAIMAEGDLVTMAFLREFENPNAPGQTYTTTWFDMFRIENGRVAEHWDYGTIAPR